MPFLSDRTEINYAANPCNTEVASDPGTEVGVLDNTSIFSASVASETIEKPQDNVVTVEDNKGGDETQHSQDRDRSTSQVENPEKKEFASFTNLRHKSIKQPIGWERIELAAPMDDPEDEFDIGTAQKPVFQEGTKGVKNEFLNGEPSMDGEVMSCFEEPGLLYRIVDKKKKTWAFYNDSLAFEVHVSCTFGKHSKVEPLGNTKMHQLPDGSYTAEVVVYPVETEKFIKGYVNGFSSQLRALPLSDEYFETRLTFQHENFLEKEFDAVKSLVGEWKGAEDALKSCIENDVPFVDFDFLPVWKSIQLGSTRAPKKMLWLRPRMYLPEGQVEQVRLFRRPIFPGGVEQGELGDCWLMCAIATLEEDPGDVMRMFRNPFGAETARRERTVGAYRVTLNTSGLWRSVIVDDYFPGYAGMPRFAHSSDACEVWPSVLQKAFAKLNGSYGLVQSGDPVHALTDMTGCPASRFDEVFAGAQENGGKELFQQLLQYQESGFQLILTTAGKAPAFVAGTNKIASIFDEEPELEGILGDTGILPGHAYTVTDVRYFPKEGDLQLLQIRNVWGSCEDWSGPWSLESSEWDSHPEVRDACGSSDRNDKVIWMDWQHVLKYFAGGGVIYRHPAYDYRIPLVFTDCRPSLVLEVSVDSPVWMCFILSNVNPRTVQDYTSNLDKTHEYPPLMLSLSTAQAGNDDEHKVIQNTSVDAAKPSRDKWTFTQAREISMLCRLTPDESPYLVIPRMMENEDTVSGSTAWFANLRDRICPLHFRNCNAAPSDVDSEAAAEIPVVLGVRCSRPIGAEGDGGVKLNFKCIEDENVVFENFPKFPAETMELNDIYYQAMSPTRGYAEEKMGGSIF
ncbi:calpain-like cysteine peptidase [Trypanosoma cruzi marinkellei]|uniref:Calpain-like cysteine peptidase n=1 Tax=Trypanosoma cruzi marinkellei TaxID=85056 RepID=K2MTB2_TRYCR|nr:calpain-like cysteine peptidase [Trypanosoma cruzi marinkellei]